MGCKNAFNTHTYLTKTFPFLLFLSTMMSFMIPSWFNDQNNMREREDFWGSLAFLKHWPINFWPRLRPILHFLCPKLLFSSAWSCSHCQPFLWISLFLYEDSLFITQKSLKKWNRIPLSHCLFSPTLPLQTLFPITSLVVVFEKKQMLLFICQFNFHLNVFPHILN